MKQIILTFGILFSVFGCSSDVKKGGTSGISTEMSADRLLDKIKGGWAGQVIGCTFGGPTEFGYPGTMIGDNQPIAWDDSRIGWYFEHSPGLYDDVYMDLTFLEVMDKEGIDAPASSHAMAFAHAPYPLWHANQAARNMILNGIMPPESGHWINNPHSDDIDFQIEADFAGLISPGMPNAASVLCDRVGHIMNYGDGWYGGVYMAAMYSLAFISNDVQYIVEEGLRAIPPASTFCKCIDAVIKTWKKNPADWKDAWFAVERDWAGDIGCPDGVFRPFNIDARVNAAYVVIGLLYGRGDFARTLEISTRCGQDSDCNPASAGGILGTMLGYEKIPAYWSNSLKPIEDKPFAYTTLSLNRVYEISNRLAIEMIRKNGGSVEAGSIRIQDSEMKTVKLEQGFQGIYPVERRRIGGVFDAKTEIRFEGTGFTLTGEAAGADESGTIEIEISVDGRPAEQIRMPLSSHDRRLDIAWKFGLENSMHTVQLRIVNSPANSRVRIDDLIIYRPQPFVPDL